MFSICAIFYGDYLALAEKLLTSLKITAHIQDVRLGLNAVSPQVRNYVNSWALQQMSAYPVYIYEDECSNNLGKYPLMRQMFKDKKLAAKIMWFDDDSFLDEVSVDWWDTALMLGQQYTQVGALHSIGQKRKQYEGIAQQSWFTGKPVNGYHRYKFATGGWWIADTDFLTKWDYPFVVLHHNGGDSILGELIRQQGGSLGEFSAGVQCHCEGCLKNKIKLNSVVRINVGGRKGRRGLGTLVEHYPWEDGNANSPINYQTFGLKIARYVSCNKEKI